MRAQAVERSADVPLLRAVPVAVALTVPGFAVWYVFFALQPTEGGSQLFNVSLAVLALSVVAAAVAFVLNRFHWFVLAVLLVRPAIEVFDAGADPSETTGATTIIGIAFLAAGIAWLLIQWAAGSWIDSWSSERGLVVFLAAVGLATLGSELPAVSFEAFVKIAAGVVLLAIVGQLLRAGVLQRDHLVVVVLLSAAYPIFMGYVEVAGGLEIDPVDGVRRVRGIFPHPNPFATYLLAILLPASVIALERRGALRVVAGGIALTGLPLLQLTSARFAWLSFVAGVCLYALVRRRQLLIAIALGTGLLVVAVPSVLDRFDDLDESHYLEGVPGNSLQWRRSYWSESIEIAERSPVTGVGLDVVPTKTSVGLEPHSLYVQLYAETGVLGLAGLVAFVVVAAREIVGRIVALGRRSPEALWPTLALMAGATFLLAASTENYLTKTIVYWFFLIWIPIGVHRDASAGTPRGVAPRPRPVAAPR